MVNDHEIVRAATSRQWSRAQSMCETMGGVSSPMWSFPFLNDVTTGGQPEIHLTYIYTKRFAKMAFVRARVPLRPRPSPVGKCYRRVIRVQYISFVVCLLNARNFRVGQKATHPKIYMCVHTHIPAKWPRWSLNWWPVRPGYCIWSTCRRTHVRRLLESTLVDL